MKSISEFARDILPNTIIKAKDLISLTRVVAIICNSFSSRLTQRTLQLSRLPIDFWGALLPLSIACQTPETRHSTFVAGRLKTLLLPNNFPSIFIFSQPDGRLGPLEDLIDVYSGALEALSKSRRKCQSRHPCLHWITKNSRPLCPAHKMERVGYQIATGNLSPMTAQCVGMIGSVQRPSRLSQRTNHSTF